MIRFQDGTTQRIRTTLAGGRLDAADPAARGRRRTGAMNTQLLIQLLVNGLIVGTLYGVVAMSFVLIYKATQVVNFAQGELLLIGAWVCWWLLTKYQVPFYLGMPITLVFMFVFGIAIQVVHAAPDDRRADHLGDHGDDRAVDRVLRRAMKWIFGVNLQPFPPIFTDPDRQYPRPADPDRLSDEPRGLAGDDGRHGVVLPRLQIRPRDARHRVRPAGGAVARHLGQERLRHGLGDLGDRLGRGRRRRRRGQRRVGRACRSTASRCFRR